MAQGLGFAIPAKTAQWVMMELLARGRVRRLTLGIAATVTPLPRRVARAHDLLNDQAVEVLGVTPGGPADRAGVQLKDLIVAINGRIVTGVDDLHRLLSGSAAPQVARRHHRPTRATAGNFDRAPGVGLIPLGRRNEAG